MLLLSFFEAAPEISEPLDGKIIVIITSGNSPTVHNNRTGAIKGRNEGGGGSAAAASYAMLRQLRYAVDWPGLSLSLARTYMQRELRQRA